MTSEEAKQALKEGKKVRCCGWRKGEYISMVSWVIDESGFKTNVDYFKGLAEQEYDWEIVE